MKNLFTATKEEGEIISKIARKFCDIANNKGWKCCDAIDVEMDIEAVHCNCIPLRLEDMLNADEFSLIHDICGINRNLNRETGQIENFFLPRFSKPEKTTDDE